MPPLKTHYSVRLEGRKRKTSFKGSRHTVYKKLAKLGYSYDRSARRWTKQKEVMEIVFYGLIVDSEGSGAIVDYSAYTNEFDIVKIKQEFKKQGYEKLLPYGKADLFVIAGRKTKLPANESVLSIEEAVSKIIDARRAPTKSEKKAEAARRKLLKPELKLVHKNDGSRENYKEELRYYDEGE